MNRLINLRFLRGYTTGLNHNEPTLRSVAKHKDVTPSGAISGGWLMSQMDLAGGVVAWDVTKGPIYTIACKDLLFHKTVEPGDLVSFYAALVKINNTSLNVFVKGKIRQPPSKKDLCVTTGTFIYVSIDKNNKPRKISAGNNKGMDVTAWLEKNLPKHLTTNVATQP
jgi:acyl-CoA thioesterase YciA